MVSKSFVRRLWFILPIVMLIGLRTVGAAVDVLFERDRIPLSESFQITFEIDASSQANPDFSPLQKDLDILARSQSTNISMVNGQYRAMTRWTLEVMAKHPGTLTIPAITFGSETSPVKTITVTEEQESQENSQAKEIFFEVDAHPKNPYVQAEVIYTVRLFRAVNTHNSSLSEPQFQGGKVLVEKLGDDTSFETRREGKRYLVVERKYAIFPQSSGQLGIEPVVFTGKIGTGPRLLLDPFGAKPRVTRARSERITLQVRAIPDSFTGTTWLPANQLQLSDTWTNDPPVFKVGDPITRTLALIAGGLTSAQLPELRPDIPKSFKRYPDQPSLNDKLDPSGVVGIRQEKIALIPAQAGAFVLPEITIPWWNTEQDRMEHTTLPALEVTVAAAAAHNPPPPAKVENLPQASKLEIPANTLTPKTESSPSPSQIWIIISTVLAFGWAGTGLIWWLSRRTHKQRALVNTKKQSTRQALKDIKRACTRNNPSAVKDALLRWSEAQWPQHPPKSLGMLVERCTPELQEELEKLNQSLYSQTSATWQGSEFWTAFERHGPRQATAKSESKMSKLEPLYRI